MYANLWPPGPLPLASRHALSDVSASLAAAYAAGYRCLDCNSETELVELVPGVFRLNVAHDATCPTLRRMVGR